MVVDRREPILETTDLPGLDPKEEAFSKLSGDYNALYGENLDLMRVITNLNRTRRNSAEARKQLIQNLMKLSHVSQTLSARFLKLDAEKAEHYLAAAKYYLQQMRFHEWILVKSEENSEGISTPEDIISAMRLSRGEIDHATDDHNVN